LIKDYGRFKVYKSKCKYLKLKSKNITVKKQFLIYPGTILKKLNAVPISELIIPKIDHGEPKKTTINFTIFMRAII